MKFKQCLNKTKIFIFAMMLVFATIFGVLTANFNTLDSYASNYIGMEEIENAFANSNFESVSGSNYPSTPNNFEVLGKATDAEGNNYNGVIDLKDAEYKDLYQNFNPDEEKQYVLMIQSSAEYKTNSAYSLLADSHYEISVQVYTDVDEAIASVILYDADSTETATLASIDEISSIGSWKTCSFYVSTNEFSALNIKLGLSANGNGVALFDNIKVRKLSELVLNDIKNENYVDKRIDNPAEESEFVVKDDVLAPNKNIFTQYSTYSNVDASYLTDGVEITDGTNNSAFVLSHQEKTYSAFKTSDDYLTFEQNNLYRLSITAKALELNGSASLKLIETGFIDGDAKSQTISLSSSAGVNSMNGYSKYHFFIKAPSTKNAQFKLEIEFGTTANEDEESGFASGQIYISEIKLMKINSTTFNSGSNKIEFSSTDGDGMLGNGEFNAMQVNDASKPYPAQPDSWTVGLGNGNQIYGVVNTEETNYSKMIADNSLSRLANSNPYPTQNNNVLLMYNAEADKLTYTSATKSLTAGEDLHAFYVKVFPVFANVKISLVNVVDGENIELGAKTIEQSGNWQDVALFLKTPYQNLDVAVQIVLDTDDWGACFVDDAMFDNPTPSKEIFENHNGIDLSNLFYTENLNENNFSSPAFFVGTGELANNNAGIINLENPNLTSIVPITDEDELNQLKTYNCENKNVLAILAVEKSFFTYNSKIGISLNANSYYKFSVDVFTRNITEGNGAYVALSSFEEAFKEIKTTGWQTYTFYIKPDSNALNTTLSLGIGNSSTKCCGNVFFGNIQFEKLDVADDDAFNQLAKPSKTTLVLNKVKTDDADEDEQTNQSSNNGRVNWWYFIPSLVFAVAIIICVVGVMLRKVKWKKPNKKVKNSYDRNKTVSVQYYTRKATIEREAKIRELQKEISNLAKERVKYEDEYKHDLTKMRELKIKHSSANEIAALDKDMKKNRKLTSAIGMNINKLEGELSYVKSDAYLNNLIKKLSTEKRPVEVEETETVKVENKNVNVENKNNNAENKDTNAEQTKANAKENKNANAENKNVEENKDASVEQVDKNKKA